MRTPDPAHDEGRPVGSWAARQHHTEETVTDVVEIDRPEWDSDGVDIKA